MGPTYRYSTYRNSDVYADFLEHYVGYGPRVERWEDCPRPTQKAIYIWINGHRYYYSYGVKRLQPADSEKEQEMNNNIQWKVANVSIERNDPIRAPEVTAELRAYFKKWPDTLNPMTISDDLNRMLGEEWQYVKNDYAVQVELYKKLTTDGLRASTKLPKIKKVIFNNPATIVFWADETKTIVKCQEKDIYDPEKGLAMAITKKALGNEGNYFETIKKWTEQCVSHGL